MTNSLYIVKFYDNEVNETTEMQFESFDHAKETYFELKSQEGIEHLHIVEYKKGEYYLIQI